MQAPSRLLDLRSFPADQDTVVIDAQAQTVVKVSFGFSVLDEWSCGCG
jgi:hypothetical protein